MKVSSLMKATSFMKVRSTMEVIPTMAPPAGSYVGQTSGVDQQPVPADPLGSCHPGAVRNR
jgi:hypothetical protein